jgi:hypothetical protein
MFENVGNFMNYWSPSNWEYFKFRHRKGNRLSSGPGSNLTISGPNGQKNF